MTWPPKYEHREYSENLYEWSPRGVSDPHGSEWARVYYTCRFCPGRGDEPGEVDHSPSCPVVSEERAVTDGGRVGPILLANPIAREQFLLNGEVVTFRAGERRTTGVTHTRWERTGKGMADVHVEHITEVDPTEDPTPFSEYADRSGFGGAEPWLMAIGKSDGHGTVGELPPGHLYRVTFTRARDPLKEWLQSEDTDGRLVLCDGCGERVAPYLTGHGGAVSRDVRTPLGTRALDHSWCAWDETGPEPEERPDGWRFTLPERGENDG